jgi:hypothetical protein
VQLGRYSTCLCLIGKYCTVHRGPGSSEAGFAKFFVSIGAMGRGVLCYEGGMGVRSCSNTSLGWLGVCFEIGGGLWGYEGRGRRHRVEGPAGYQILESAAGSCVSGLGCRFVGKGCGGTGIRGGARRQGRGPCLCCEVVHLLR